MDRLVCRRGPMMDELELMLDRSRRNSTLLERYDDRRTVYELCGADVFRAFEEQLSPETRLALVVVADLFDVEGGKPLAEIDADAATVAGDDRALAGYLILMAEDAVG
jgi:hypothetical protein